MIIIVYPSLNVYPTQSSLYSTYQNDIFLPAHNHPLYTPFSSSMYTPYQVMASDIHDNYNTTLKNPYLDNYAYSQLSQDSLHGPQKSFSLEDNMYSYTDNFFDDQFVLDNEHFFESSEALHKSFEELLPGPATQTSDRVESINQSSQDLSPSTSRFPATGFKEFIPKTNTEQPVNLEVPEEKKQPVEQKSEPSKKEASKPSSLVQSPSSDVLSMGSIFSNPRTRRRDDNFELFMDSNGIPDSMADVMSPGLSFNTQWRDDGW